MVQILKEGYTLPFQTRPKLTRSPSVISCYVYPQRNSYLLEALHQLIDKNAVEVVRNKNSLSFFNRLFLVPKPNNKWRPILDLSHLNLLQNGEIQNGDTGDHQSIPSRRGVGNFHRLQRCLLPHSNSRTIQKVPEVSRPGANIPVQSVTLRPVNSTFRVHCSSKGGETDGHFQGYKDPPIPRRLVGPGQIPPSLSPTIG